MEDGGSIATGGEAQFSVSSFRNFHFMTILSSSQLSLSEHIFPLCGIRQTA